MGYEDYALIKKSTLTDIGDAIREKTKGSKLIDPANFASEIEGISGCLTLEGGYTVNFHDTEGNLIETHSALVGNSVDKPVTYVPVTWRDSANSIKQFPMTMTEVGETDIFASNYSYNLLNCNPFINIFSGGVTATPHKDNGGYLRYIETTGSCNDDAWIDIGTVTLEAGVEYVFTGCPSGGTNVTGTNYDAYALQLYTASYDWARIETGAGDVFTPSRQIDAICRICIARKTNNANGKKWYPMVRRSDTGEGVYLPYAGD